MNKKEALAQLEEHLSSAPTKLKQHTLKLWEEQAMDANGISWRADSFIVWSRSNELVNFWLAIDRKHWEEAQDELSELNLNPYKPNWFEKLPLHWRYIYHMAGGILIGYLLHYLF